jgi:hypothetical protein
MGAARTAHSCGQQEKTMRLLAIAATFAFLITAGAATAAPMSTAPGLETGTLSMLQLIQARPKSDTVGQRIKRAWRAMTDYQFCARCSFLVFPLSSSTCSVSRAKSRDEARATCGARYPLCAISDGTC